MGAPAADQRVTVLTGPFVAAATVLTAFVVLTTVVPLDGATTPIDVVSVHVALQAAASVLAVLSGFVLAMHARVSANTVSAWVASALVALGVLTLGVGALGPLVGSSAASTDAVAWLQPGGRGGVLILLVIALWTSRSQSTWRRRPSRVLLFTLASTAAGTVLFQVAPAIGRPFASVHDVAYGFAAGRPAGVGALLPVLWLVLGVAYVATAARRREATLAWVALAFLGFGAAEFGHRALVETGQFVSLGASIVQAAGLACVFVGVTRHLLVAMGEDQGALLSRAEAAEEHANRARRHQREQVHEARNALGGIVNTLRMLDEHGDRVDDAQQRELLGATFSELVRLQHLFAPDQTAHPEAFDVAETLTPVIAATRANGLDVETDLPSGLVASGSWAGTTQALQNLLENIRRHAPGSSARVDARAEGDRIVVRVTDDGPGIPADERERIFESGTRGALAHDTPGSGLGLAITAELMRRQQGEVRVESELGRGSRFVLSLPAHVRREASRGAAGRVNGSDVPATTTDTDPDVGVRRAEGPIAAR